MISFYLETCFHGGEKTEVKVRTSDTRFQAPGGQNLVLIAQSAIDFM